MPPVQVLQSIAESCWIRQDFLMKSILPIWKTGYRLPGRLLGMRLVLPKGRVLHVGSGTTGSRYNPLKSAIHPGIMSI